MKGMYTFACWVCVCRRFESEVATNSHDKPAGTKVVMLNDVARAFFEAPMQRTVCVELPSEALEGEETQRTR